MLNSGSENDTRGHAFSVGISGKSSDRVTVSVGGHPVEFIIDSGASVNITDKEQWEDLKKKHLKCHSEKCEKKLYAYDATEPLNLLGKFRAQMV
jgi:hypothetical protein